MTLPEQIAKNIIKRLLKGEDYRVEVINLIDANFLQFAIDFFKKVIHAKLNSESITTSWYKDEFINSNIPPEELAIHSGLNMKTIENMFNSRSKKVVIDASIKHYDALYSMIESLVDSEESLEFNLTLKFKDVSVELNVNETLIVINTLAVKRATIRGGLWSTAGKRVEKPLMQTLCKLYNVPPENYRIDNLDMGIQDDFIREVDFYLLRGTSEFKCEVKLMGKGNPESADAVIARDSQIFVADKLSSTNKAQLKQCGIQWVELRSPTGFRKFGTVLKKLEIPFTDSKFSNLENRIEKIFKEIFV